MEELYVYAILCGLDLEKGDKYREKLEQLLELNPSDEILIDLYDRAYKDSLLHIHSIMNEYSLNCELFGNILMKELKKYMRLLKLRSLVRKCVNYGTDFLMQ